MSLADAVEEDISRIVKATGLEQNGKYRSDELWDFFHSIFMHVTDVQWRHEAGVSRTRKK